MPYEVKFTKKADSDLENRMDSLEYYDESAVIRFIEKLKQRLDHLSVFPKIGTLIPIEDIDQEMRFAKVDRYIFVYSIDEPSEVITIMRIFDDGQNWQNFI